MVPSSVVRWLGSRVIFRIADDYQQGITAAGDNQYQAGDLPCHPHGIARRMRRSRLLKFGDPACHHVIVHHSIPPG